MDLKRELVLTYSEACRDFTAILHYLRFSFNLVDLTVLHEISKA